MISDLYKGISAKEGKSTTQGIPRASNVPSATEIGGDINDGTTGTDVLIITMTQEILVLKKLATTSTNISIAKVSRSTTSI